MLIVGKSTLVAWYPVGNICKYSHPTFKIALLSADYLCEWHPLWKTQRAAQGWDGERRRLLPKSDTGNFIWRPSDLGYI